MSDTGVHLFVDVDAVGQLAGSLAGIRESLLNATASFAAGGAAACSDAVASALASFGKGWHDGRKTITDEVEDLAQAARGSAQAYQQAESRIVTDTSRGGVSVGVGGGR